MPGDGMKGEMKTYSRYQEDALRGGDFRWKMILENWTRR